MVPFTGNSWPFSHQNSSHFQVVSFLERETWWEWEVVSQLRERTMRWHNLLTALHSWAYFLSLLLLLLLLRLQWDKKQNATRNCKRYQIIFNYVRLVRVTGVARSNAAIRRPVPLCRYIYYIWYTIHTMYLTTPIGYLPGRAPGTLIQLQMVATTNKKWGRRVT